MVPFSITGIYYCNTNNGYTAFEDGDQIESVQNRLVLFPSNMKHSGSTCTDVNSRVAININFIPRYVEDSMYKDIIDVEVWNQIEKWCDKAE
jgi:predicted nuclease of restriction endonuclease-like RecB superfamily